MQTGYILAIRAIKQKDDSIGYLRGLGAGTIAALVSAFVAVVAQVGYFKVMHPAWPDTMIEQTREHFTAQGMSSMQVNQMVEQARGNFTLKNYAITSAATEFVLGVILSAIIIFFLCRKAHQRSRTM